MPVFRIEIQIEATAYVKAEDAKEAQAQIAALDGTGMELSLIGGDIQASDEVWISGLPYNDPLLPGISLSPAMTLRTADDDGAVGDAEQVEPDEADPAP